jgi:hypothetical protein
MKDKDMLGDIVDAIVIRHRCHPRSAPFGRVVTSAQGRMRFDRLDRSITQAGKTPPSVIISVNQRSSSEAGVE